MFKVQSVDTGSAASRAGMQKGDIIVSINGEPLIDYIDYVYFASQEKLKIAVKRGEELFRLRVDKDEQEDIGLNFTEPLLGKKRVCANKCVFCFVDQLPKGMRRSLYLKDEDWRYSFVMGNYVTMSSIHKSEVQRIIRRGASPLYISVHTVDETLRQKMLGNKNAVPIRPLLRKLAAHHIRFHAQVVVCPGLNDGEKLRETIRFLRRLHPAVISLAVVPVGLSAHRDKLFELTPVTKDVARQTIEEVEKNQKECLNRMGTRFVFAADEFYIKAGLELPPETEYETFNQIENGVGLIPKFMDEVETALDTCEGKYSHISIATGVDAYPYFEKLALKVEERCKTRVDVYSVNNETFGGGVTVSGLLGGRDFIRTLSGKDLGEMLLISASTLRDGAVFLDDVTFDELKQQLNVKIEPVSDGFHLADILT